MTGVKFPISISSYYPIPKTPNLTDKQPVDEKTPIWKHIRINNVTAINSPNAGVIYGLPEMHMDDIVLNNVKISAKKPLIIVNADNVKFIGGSSVQLDPPGAAPLQVTNSTVTGIDPATGQPN
jgi:hypothetical protein